MPSDHATEIAAGNRFAFGKNWQNFLDRLTDSRIEAACGSMQKLLGSDSLDGKSFLDIGSGSGLFSLAAMRLGAARVCSFDYDPQSMACTRELRRRCFPGNPRWAILEGSVLDASFVSSLGKYDIVYSWGVLHHTGGLWGAIENAMHCVAPRGLFALAIYNDQGRRSRVWRRIKKAYCRTPGWLRPILFLPIPLYYELKWMAADLVHGKVPFGSWRTQSDRGMSPWHDWLDWLGGYPFEVARPENVIDFFHRNGFRVEKLNPCGDGWANNEFLFRATAAGTAEDV